MRSLSVVSCLLVSVISWGQVQHPVDFEDTYFRKTPFSRWMRDPFKNPPGFAKSALAKAKWPKLESVDLNDAASSAVLDGKKYIEGQFIDEDRYVSVIGQNYVIITSGDFDYELVLPDPKRNLASELEDKK